jgi:hypothetical protein
MSSLVLRTTLAALLTVAWAPPGLAQDTHVGDLFGDLVHIKRDPATGQAILQKRWVELPGDTFDWAYCPIPVDAFGLEIPFADLTCDPDPTQLARLVEVDYFGRLSGGRTRESNLRMHFDESIRSISLADLVVTDESGRLKLGTDCTAAGTCAAWKLIDSPFENLGMYHRVMKYGHIQTDPAEVDESAHGDPEAGTVYHPALSTEDWAKFRGAAVALLPRASVGECFSGETFVAACAAPQSLSAADFRNAASMLAGAADKTGRVTPDLIAYMNRILSITKDTALSEANLDTLPALIRDENGGIAPASLGLPAPADERFVNFGAVVYARTDQFGQPVTVLVDQGGGVWRVTTGVSLLEFLRFMNGATATGANGSGFVLNTLDALRVVEFIHNYEPPENLRAIAGAATVVTVQPALASVSATPQITALSATVTNGTTVNGGLVTFTAQTLAGVVVGVATPSEPVANGMAVASYVLPANTPAQVLMITAAYSGSTGFFAPSVGTSTLTISSGTLCSAAIQPTVANAPAGGGTATVSLTTAAECAWTATDDASWLMVSTSSGTGTATIEYVVERNTTGLTRTGHVIVASQLLTVTQPPLPVVSSDFNGDGFADLVWQHTDGTIVLWLMNGAQMTSATYLTPTSVSDASWRVVSTGDFNHDGHPDVLWHNRTTGAVGIWLMQGTTALSSTVVLPNSDLRMRLVGAADVNQDGWSDLVWQHASDGRIVVYFMEQTQITTSAEIAPPTGGAAWVLMQAVDLNANGYPDLVWKNDDGRILVSWLQGTTVQSSEPTTPSTVPNPDWRIVGAADLNADGSVDLLWQHVTAGTALIWWMNGLVGTSWDPLVPDVDASWSIVALH